MSSVFDAIAEDYDGWYETPGGKAAFTAEYSCLQSLVDDTSGEWLEVGAGTGRFASSLGIRRGIDPSRSMLAIAKRRGVETFVGTAEALPFPPQSADGILMALTLCFVQDAAKALRECRRVLRPSGRLLLGIVPSDSPWGRAYAEEAAEGHPVYSHARFRTAAETAQLAKSAGFTLLSAASTLFWGPDEHPEQELDVRPGIVPEAGFVGLLFAPR